MVVVAHGDLKTLVDSEHYAKKSEYSKSSFLLSVLKFDFAFHLMTIP